MGLRQPGPPLARHWRPQRLRTLSMRAARGRSFARAQSARWIGRACPAHCCLLYTSPSPRD
eukprot:3491948-Alexandrium_andersonii.AAC.1